jgi:hypothetical protein
MEIKSEEITGENKKQKLIEFRDDLLELNRQILQSKLKLNDSFLPEKTIDEYRKSYDDHIKENKYLIEITTL